MGVALHTAVTAYHSIYIGTSSDWDSKPLATKGQLISKCPFGVTLSTKIATKLLSGFLPYYGNMTI